MSTVDFHFLSHFLPKGKIGNKFRAEPHLSVFFFGTHSPGTVRRENEDACSVDTGEYSHWEPKVRI